MIPATPQAVTFWRCNGAMSQFVEIILIAEQNFVMRIRIKGTLVFCQFAGRTTHVNLLKKILCAYTLVHRKFDIQIRTIDELRRYC